MLFSTAWVGLWGFLWWAPSAKRKDHHGVSSGWSSIWPHSIWADPIFFFFIFIKHFDGFIVKLYFTCWNYSFSSVWYIIAAWDLDLPGRCLWCLRKAVKLNHPHFFFSCVSGVQPTEPSHGLWVPAWRLVIGCGRRSLAGRLPSQGGHCCATHGTTRIRTWQRPHKRDSKWTRAEVGRLGTGIAAWATYQHRSRIAKTEYWMWLAQP